MGADARIQHSAAAGKSRRSQEREAEACWPPPRAAQGSGANQVLADLAENLSGIEAARRTEMLDATSLLPQAELTFKAALAGYETGKVDFATLLDAQRQIRKARQDRKIKAQAEAQFAPGRNRKIAGRRPMKQGTGCVCRRGGCRLGGGYWLGSGAKASAAAEPGETAAACAAAEKQERKLLYYRNPMGLPDTSPTPKKDPMGMDYIAGLRRRGGDGGGDSAPRQVRSAPKRSRSSASHRSGQLRVLDKQRARSGRIEPDERRTYAIRPSSRATSSACTSMPPASRWQRASRCSRSTARNWSRRSASTPSPRKASSSLKDAGGEAQAGMKQLAESSLLRLRNWDISDEQIKALAKSGERSAR
jgi:hypothetical protein